MDNMRKILSDAFGDDREKLEEAFVDYFKANGRKIGDVRLANKVTSDIKNLLGKEKDLIIKIKNLIGKEKDFVEKMSPKAREEAKFRHEKNSLQKYIIDKSNLENEKLEAFLDDRLEEVQDVEKDVAEIEGEPAPEESDEEKGDLGQPTDSTGDGKDNAVKTEKGDSDLTDEDGDGKADTMTHPDGSTEKIVGYDGDKVITVPEDEIEPETGEPQEDAEKNEYPISDELEPILPEPSSDQEDLSVASDEEVNDALEQAADGIDPNWMKNTVGKLPKEQLPEFKEKIDEFIQDETRMKSFIEDVANEAIKEYPNIKERTDTSRLKRHIKEIVQSTLAEFINDDFNSIETIKNSENEIVDKIIQDKKEKAGGAGIGTSAKFKPFYVTLVGKALEHFQNIIGKSLEDINLDDISSENPEEIRESIRRLVFGGKKKMLSLTETYDSHREELVQLLEKETRFKMADKIKSFGKQKEKLLDQLMKVYNEYVKKLEKYVPKATEAGTKDALEKEIARLKKKIENFFKMKHNAMEVVKKTEDAEKGKIDKEDVKEVSDETEELVDAGDDSEEEATPEEEEEIKQEIEEFEKESVPTENATISQILDKTGKEKTDTPDWVKEGLKDKAPQKIGLQKTGWERMRQFAQDSNAVKTESRNTKLSRMLKESFWKGEIKEEQGDKKDFGVPHKPGLFVWLPEEAIRDVTPEDKIEKIKSKIKATTVKPHTVKASDGDKTTYSFLDDTRKEILKLDSEGVDAKYEELVGDDDIKADIGFVTGIDWSRGKARVVLYKTVKSDGAGRKYKKTNKEKDVILKSLKEIPAQYFTGLKGLMQYVKSPWKNVKNDFIKLIAGIKGIKAGYDKVTDALTDKDMYDLNQPLKMGESEIE